MPALQIATCATAVPMGAQVYQEEVASRAGRALGDSWTVDRTIVRSLRSPLPGTRRLPMGWLLTASTRERRLAGRFLYGRTGVVHRMNLELPPSPRPEVVTLHDAVAWKFPDEAASVEAATDELRQAAAVICVSAFTASEAVEVLGIHDPVVVPNGVDGRFFDASPLSDDQRRSLGVEGRYVLASGGASVRKNLDGLASAWVQVRQADPTLTLVLSGPEHPRRTGLFGGLDGVRMVGRVDASLVPGLMASATAVVVPSRYEGFGLPALEAMAVGTPVVAAATSSLPEVVGDGGTLVEPTASGLADGILHAVSGDREVQVMAARGRARADGFTWERSVAGHAAVWERVAALG